MMTMMMNFTANKSTSKVIMRNNRLVSHNISSWRRIQFYEDLVRRNSSLTSSSSLSSGRSDVAQDLQRLFLLPSRHRQHRQRQDQLIRHYHSTTKLCFKKTSIIATGAGEQQQPRRPSSINLSKADFDYCVDLVQNRDRESYLCGLLMPAEARKAYFAVRAFNVEVASIKSGSVSRQVGGAQFAGYEGTDASAALRIRMQWWRDALDQIYNQDQDDTNRSSSSKNDGTKPPSNAFFDSIASSYMKNPVVRVLDYAVHEKQLTRRFLERLLEAREANLESKQPATLDEAVAYADETFASLFYLALETCGVRDDKADVVAQHAGIGVGLATSLRAAPWIILQDGECSIPQQVIPKQFPYHKLYSYYQDATSRPSHEQNGDSDDGDKAKSPTAKLNDEEFKMLKDAVEQVAALAYFHISMAQQLQGNVPKRARTCLLPAIPALHYLTKLEKANYNIFDGSVFVDPRQPQNQSNLTLLALLGRSWLTGVI